MNKKNKNMKYKENDKVSLEPDLELERKMATRQGDSGYDFVVRTHHWTSPDEQKIKTQEIEEKTKDK